MEEEEYGQSTHYSFFPGLDSSGVDHLLLAPKTTWRGFRGARPTFPVFDEYPEEEELDLYEGYDARFGGVTSGWENESARIAQDASEGQSLSDKAWKQFPAGQAALAFGRRLRSRISGSRGRYNKNVGKVYFTLRAAPGTHEASFRKIAVEVSETYEVPVSVYRSNASLTATFFDDLPSREQMGRLFPARSHGRLEAAGPSDTGVLLTRSGHSGMRGGKSPFPSSLLGTEAAPKQQYTRYGAQGAGPGTGRIKTSFFEYEGSAIGAAVMGVGALAVLYRAVGGDPLF